MIDTEAQLVVQGPPAAPDAHFLNNVLAAASSYVEEDPAVARELLADLGAFLAYRLRGDRTPVPLADELEFARTYLRLEAARHGDRLEAHVDEPPEGGATIVPLSVQAPLQEALDRRLRERPGGQRVAVRVAGDARTVRLDLAGLPDGAYPERHVVDVRAPA